MHGDTTSAAAAALASFHLAPTIHSQSNLEREGIDGSRVFVTGNTTVDALAVAAAQQVPYEDRALADLEGPEAPRTVLVTAHRRENRGASLGRIAEAMATLAERHADVRFVVATHSNRAVADVLHERLGGTGNVSLVAPMAYGSFARLLAHASVAITDSGGVQEEAPSLGTPVLSVRETTERQEGVRAGTVELVGTDTQRIVRALQHVVFDTTPPESFGLGFDRRTVLSAGGSADPTESGWVNQPREPE